jgi:hypothetical protein
LIYIEKSQFLSRNIWGSTGLIAALFFDLILRAESPPCAGGNQPISPGGGSFLDEHQDMNHGQRRAPRKKQEL